MKRRKKNRPASILECMLYLIIMLIMSENAKSKKKNEMSSSPGSVTGSASDAPHSSD